MGNKLLQALLICSLLPASFTTATAQESIELTEAEAQTLYRATSKARVSVHDPSIVWNPDNKTYYIFGTHRGAARSTDLKNWTGFVAPWGVPSGNGSIVEVEPTEAFLTNQTKSVTIGGKEVQFGNFDALAWAGAYGGDYNIYGNMWAPDVIYNTAMKKWCMYLSVNGPSMNSVIILLTASNIEGPYVYQGPVVYSGFGVNDDARTSYKLTDLELVTGTLSAIPDRYHLYGGYGGTWTNCIDPCVFYDEEGKLWMAYGSWFGGIWILELDEETGLRDYNIKYGSNYSSLGENVTIDPYYGKKLHGGHWVSGEGSYIEHIGNYYYMFLSYGGLESTGGYQMRVFRSSNPDGPYTDTNGISAIYERNVGNFGVNADTRGEKILGSYADWGFMTVGELAQGHNSIIHAEDGRNYLVYHTRFDDGGEGHQVRTHQVFVNQDGWLVAAPFEYNGETVTDDDIESSQMFSKEEVAGTYDILIHRYSLDHAARETVKPERIVLGTDGKVTGAYTGTWGLVSGKSYINISIGGTFYRGVVIEEEMDFQNIKVIAFTACAKTGVNLWGYKLQDKYRLAYQLRNQELPLTDNQNVSRNIELSELNLDMPGDVEIAMTSSEPEIISSTGRYNPSGLTEPKDVTLDLQISAGNYYWKKTYNVTAKEETFPADDFSEGLTAYYNFNSTPAVNSMKVSETAKLLKQGTNKAAAIVEDDDEIRNGTVVHTFYGGHGNESFVRMNNPLYNQTLENGFSISFWTKRTDDNLWDALFAFYNTQEGSRLFMTGNTYIGYNNNSGNWIDITQPNDSHPDLLTVGQWRYVTLTVSRTSGIKMYVNGKSIPFASCNGSLNGTDFTLAQKFDYNLIVDHVTKCQYFNLGYGSFWGSADAHFDDLMIHNRVLRLSEVITLRTLESRDWNLGDVVTGIDAISYDSPATTADKAVYSINGIKVANSINDETFKSLPSGIYVSGNKKILK